MRNFVLTLFAVACFAISSSFAQDRAPSPAAKVVQKVGLTDITVEYSRPGKKERTIFAADGLVPFGKIWRTGANSATKVTFSDAVKIEGQDLPAGSYAVLTLPNAMEWRVHFYTYEAASWGGYREKEPVVAAVVKPLKFENMSLESFTIDIGNLRDYSATMVIAWDDTYVPVNITVK